MRVAFSQFPVFLLFWSVICLKFSKSFKVFYCFKVHKNHDMSEAEFVKKVLHLPTKYKGWFK
eukprot:COSAG02_NODE_72232_length_187_cov_24.806818_1_plen_61_part_11